MPIITIQLTKGRDPQTKSRIVKKITDVLVEELGSQPEWVTILFHEYEKENWASNGVLHNSKKA
jgi:4-oxalocrotonate tautomerase